ncbi:MAG: dTDP-4-dehydrorhamnose reductase [Terracidiphilus sp.]
MPRILIFGSTGQLGVELLKALTPEMDLLALSRHDADLTNEQALRKAVRDARPQFIVNCAAYTAVDRAESEPELARTINTVAPRIMAEEALRFDAWLLHFSTDYVFDGSGDKPWKETDLPNPLNVYGRSKLEGERAVAAVGCRHLIFRTSWVYAAHGNNFLRTMLRLGRERSRLTVVNDQIGAPTSAGELARGIYAILNRLQSQNASPIESGIYHMTCSGATSWFGFAEAIFASRSGMVSAPLLVPIPSEQYPTPAARPRNSVLNGDKLQRAMGVRLPAWQDALARVIEELSDQSAQQ